MNMSSESEEETDDDFVECLCVESFTRVQPPKVAKYCEGDDEYIHMLVNKNRQNTRDVTPITVTILLGSFVFHPP